VKSYRASTDISVLNDYLEVPGLGFLPVNAFVIHAAEPVVVDTGLGLPDREFVASLAEVIDPADVRWIWLTHPDRDHTGGLFALLDAAPQARVVTTFIGLGIMSTEKPLPLDRVYLLNPGQSLDVGDRMLTGFRPPLFDNPATVGILDAGSGACLSSDCFGAPLSSAALASAQNAAEASPDELRAWFEKHPDSYVLARATQARKLPPELRRELLFSWDESKWRVSPYALLTPYPTPLSASTPAPRNAGSARPACC